LSGYAADFPSLFTKHHATALQDSTDLHLPWDALNSHCKYSFSTFS